MMSSLKRDYDMGAATTKLLVALADDVRYVAYLVRYKVGRAYYGIRLRKR